MFSGSTTVSIYVQDINDNSPQFTQAAYAVNVSENTRPPYVLLTVNVSIYLLLPVLFWIFIMYLFAYLSEQNEVNNVTCTMQGKRKKQLTESIEDIQGKRYIGRPKNIRRREFKDR